MEEFTTWEDLPKNIKIILMYHWFSFCSSIEYTEKDIEMYEKIAQQKYDKIFDLIVSLAITTGDIDSMGLIMCMRENKIDELLDVVLDRSLFKGKEKIKYENTRILVLSDLVKTYFIAAMLNSGLDDDDDNIYRRTK